MANHIKNPEMVQRNLNKIQNWNGEDVHDILDAATIIVSKGGSINLLDFAKDVDADIKAIIPEDRVDSVIAVDVNGVILYADGSTDSVSELQEKARREQIGLEPLDNHIQFVNRLIVEYTAFEEKEKKQVAIRKRNTSALLKSYSEVLGILNRVKASLDAAALQVEANIST